MFVIQVTRTSSKNGFSSEYTDEMAVALTLDYNPNPSNTIDRKNNKPNRIQLVATFLIYLSFGQTKETS